MVALTFTLSLLGVPNVTLTDARGVEFFETRIRPVLHARCYECHSSEAKDLHGGLRLDSRAGLLAGGDTGSVIVPGSPEKSLLIRAVRFEDPDLEMPPSGKIPEREIALLVQWVKMGAPYPENGAGAARRAERARVDLATARSFWSFPMPQRRPLPKVRDTAWARGRVDGFVLAQLEKQGLSPSPPADRRTLIRRATFDLTGLPPTPSEVAQFLADESLQAYENLIERLLRSTAYGERWGRFWLDLARYCDAPAPWSVSEAKPYLYRDWVVQAFNDDMPYDEFVKRQLATDHMEETGREDLPALGFLGLSPVYWKELRLSPEVIKTIIAEEWEERIDTVSRTFLGLTAACARCHDHKFDPITTQDYYALAGVFASTQVVDRPVIAGVDEHNWIKAHADVVALKEEINLIKAVRPPPADAQKRIKEINGKIEHIRESTPHFHGLSTKAVIDSSVDVLPDGPNLTKLVYKPGVASDIAVQIRGNPSSLGRVMPRRFFAVFSQAEPVTFKNGSGRLELAEAIVGAGAPLSSRVIVNRVWLHHFGRGLVETPSNFGVQGERPSHPELLDDLAASFMTNGWSIKSLHRRLMLSATYRQASAPDADKHAIDPDNRWWWRMNRRRLEVEAWRDAMLEVSGELQRQVGGPPTDLDDTHRRRTIYGTIARRDIHDMLRLHDFPEPTAHSPGRDLTTTPLQQLFVFNSSFMRQRAAALAARLHGDDAPFEELVENAYQLLYVRSPSPEEQQLAAQFLQSDATQTRDELRVQYLQVLLGNNEFFFID